MATIAELLQRFVDEPVAEGTTPFKLRSTLSKPADPDELGAAWPERSLPDDLLALWAATREARLFEDVEYGQWGLVLLPPETSAARTARELADRPRDMRPDDIVVGEFLGDLQLLVLEPDTTRGARALIALPLDGREDWPVAGESLGDFLATYLDNNGEMFWDPARG
jgi:hypothetical protein